MLVKNGWRDGTRRPDNQLPRGDRPDARSGAVLARPPGLVVADIALPNAAVRCGGLEEQNGKGDVKLRVPRRHLPSAQEWLARVLPLPEMMAQPSSASRVARWSAVIAAALVAFFIVRATGGSPSPLNHLGYIPVLLAAPLFGARAAVLTALSVAVLLGPTAAVLGLPGGTEGAEAWTWRGLMFLLVGVTVGNLFDRSRAAIVGWEAAVVEVEERHRDGMVALARGAEARDHTTGEHIFRCHDLAGALAREVGMSPSEADDVAWAAMLHDIGKLRVPDSILLKPGALTPEEWEVMRRHPIWGEEILAGGLGFEMARRITRWHHEDFDGRGYPDGLRGEAIPLEARIVRVSDAYDAITHIRPYKTARLPEWAFEELERCAGSQFDPELVKVFVALLERDNRLRVGTVERRPAGVVMPLFSAG
jgi:hypothetical protein